MMQAPRWLSALVNLVRRLWGRGATGTDGAGSPGQGRTAEQHQSDGEAPPSHQDNIYPLW